MPTTGSPLDIAGIGGGMITGTIQNSMNNYANYQNNKKQQEWAEKMYGVQRRDALADWQMQADYNSPKAQMERLKAAGLNPNLVYGHGADAQMSASPRSSSPGSYAPKVSEQVVQGAPLIDQFQDAQIKRIQTNNLAIQAELLQQDLKNKQAQEFKIYADTTKSNLQAAGQDIKNKYAPALAEMSMEATKASIGKTLADTNKSVVTTGLAIAANERAELTTGMSLRVAAEKILNMREQRLLMQLNEEKTKAQTSQITSQNINTIYSRQNIQAQLNVIEQQRINLREITRQNTEKARILESTPDWNDARAIGMLESLLGTFTKPGTSLNPNNYRGWRK